MAEHEFTTPAQASPTITTTQSRPPYYRLGIHDAARLGYASFIAICTGTFLGIARGARTEALRFRAENAHRLPTTTKGWYLYHKSKNYAVMWNGIKGGFRMGGTLGFWVGLFFCSEMLVDRIWNKRKDFRSTMVTGVVTALAWSRFYAMSGLATRRMIMTGLKAGFGYGILQDGMALLNKRLEERPNISQSQTTSPSKT
ncbi:MAG: hypothetical protein GOMPHAMPRED_001916 [Gomphillus americanus]|uniref:Uncharacterized protein n=1 Tax=Gomphillus americanus TaxID=1940652 RepID=A0A8H3IID8_9LECA|nr:MAG: hypothetical protein GOMPHAMPRED_001916 [Gomphillus americanus]